MADLGHGKLLGLIRWDLAACEKATVGPWRADISEPWDIVVWGTETQQDSTLVFNVGPNPAPIRIGEPASDNEVADAHFIARARTLAPEMLRAIEVAVKLHSPFGIYDECGHRHESTDEPGVLDIPDVGFTCEEGRIQTICRECDTDDGEMREDSDEGTWPCPTVLVLAEPWREEMEHE